MGLQNISRWQEIGAPATVIDWIQHGVTLPFRTVPPPAHFHNRNLSDSQTTFVDSEIQKLLDQNIITESTVTPTVVSPLNVVPKKGKNKWRLIHDLRYVNSFINSSKFTNERIDVVNSLVREEDLMVTLDLKDGFFHVPVSDTHQTFLGFKWKNSYYCWKRIPFGLNVSPFYFEKTLRPVVKFLRLQGLRLALYVDDWFLTAQPNDIIKHKDLLVNTLEELGWTINFEKSSLIPENTKTWIGYVISTKTSPPCIGVTKDKTRKLRRDILRALRRRDIQARALARIAGQCVAMAQVILPAKLLLRNVYRVLATKRSWQDRLVLTEPVRKDLRWWCSALNSDWNQKPIIKRPVELQMFTDASSTGWGAWLLKYRAAGFWNSRLSSMSSNYRELSAVLMGLHSFLPLLRGRSLEIVSDNISTVAYLNHLGGSYMDLANLTTAIWGLAFHHNIHLTARYLAGRDNVLADALSRLNPRYEWKLHTSLFQWINRKWGPHTVDRCATILNTQLPRYNSRFYDPKSEAVDCLAQNNWMHENNYVNPPFRLIPMVIEKIQQQKAIATLITPKWPAQVWFQTLCEMSIAPPIMLPNSHRTVWSVCLKPEPLKNMQWQLMAWRVSGTKT